MNKTVAAARSEAARKAWVTRRRRETAEKAAQTRAARQQAKSAASLVDELDIIVESLSIMTGALNGIVECMIEIRRSLTQENPA